MTTPQVRVRPIDRWPEPDTRGRRSSPFRASERATMTLLQHELAMLDAKWGVIELVMDEGGLRLDGGLRARTSPEHPGVILYLESKHGPLRYACDQFTTWQDNLRAIALGLEALRKIDRYGIARRGEQYTGWKQLTAGGTLTRQDAERIIERHGGSVRAALKNAHPDAGGTAEAFAEVQAARAILERDKTRSVR